MNRAQLERVIAAASTIAQDPEIVVIGSRSVLGQFPEAPPALPTSTKADVYPRSHPERAELIDGSIGEGSPFHSTFGYYAQGVGRATAVLPRNWETRLIPIRSDRTRGATGLCLEIHDLLVAKLVAGRPKDLEFACTALRMRLANVDVLRERLKSTELDPRVRDAVAVRISRANDPQSAES